MRPRGSPSELEQRRLRAIELLRQGRQPVEVARIVGVDRRSVRRWKAAYKTEGEAGVKARPAPGPRSKLTDEQKEQLEDLLLKGAEAAGYPTDLWTCPRVTELIQERFGVQYHVDHVSRLLHLLGWSPQKPQRRAAERDEPAIRNWVKVSWPRIKKKRDA